MPSLCPTCLRPIARGVLRCRHCGVDARGASRQGAAVGIRTDELFPPGSRVTRVLELLERMEEISPELAAWLREDRKTRGPQPECDCEALELLEEARSLYR